MLIFHSVGSGKTALAIAIVHCLLHKYKSRGEPLEGAIFAVPVGLEGQYTRNREALGVPNRPDVQIYTHDKFINAYKRDTKLCRNKILVVDEAHRFRTQIKSNKRSLGGTPKRKRDDGDVDGNKAFWMEEDGDVDQKKAFWMIQAAQSARKVFALTGSPIYNTLSDLVNLAAMIQKVSLERVEGYYKFLDKYELYRTDSKKFIASKFKDVVSYYNNDMQSNQDEYPATRIQSIELRITGDHYAQYSMKTTKDNFHQASRQSLNEEGENAPKIDWIVNFLTNHIVGTKTPPRKVVIYSSFLEKGIYAVEKRVKEVFPDIKTARIIGEVNDRASIVNRYNANEIQILYLSKAGGEGIDLKCTSAIILLEPQWNNGSEQQVIGRAVRRNSHKHCEEGIKNKVRVYKLIAKNADPKQKTADVKLMESKQKKMDIEKFGYGILQSVSIEKPKQQIRKKSKVSST
ncbi:hypothetical protein HDU93_004911 [Gonapodya sp. JEL0774]|nr:hypothetical protein HDU93_004911 [Gonapodya sp. JEL0774]